jgi:hypothetical protein
MRRFARLLWVLILLILGALRQIIDVIGEAQTVASLPVLKWVISPWFSFAFFTMAVLVMARSYYVERIRKEPAGFAAVPYAKNEYRNQAIVGAGVVILLFVLAPIVYGHYRRPARATPRSIASVAQTSEQQLQTPAVPPAERQLTAQQTNKGNGNVIVNGNDNQVITTVFGPPIRRQSA